MTRAPQPSAEMIEAAIAAFDAGNHAWGRFRLFVLSAAPQARQVSTQAVQSALQEAALDAPAAQAGRIGPFLAALRTARDLVVAYHEALPEGVPPAELQEAAGDFEEAIALLEGRSPPV